MSAARTATEVLAELLRPAGRRRAGLDDLVASFTAASRRRLRRSVGTLRWNSAAQRTDALLTIATSAVVVEQLLAGRWRLILDALDAEVSGADIVAATGVALDEIVAGLDAHLRDRPDLYPEPRRFALLQRLTCVGS